MPIDEKTRLDLRAKFEEFMGPRLANATMEAMPPLDYDQLATKTDVANLGVELRGDMADLRGDLRGEMAELRGDLRGEMAELRGGMAELRGDMVKMESGLRGDMSKMESGLRGDMSKMLRTMVISQLGTALAVGGFVASLG